MALTPGADAPRQPDRLPAVLPHPGPGAALTVPAAPAAGPVALAAPPPALSAPPNALGLLQALRRRWVLAAFLGLVCATAAAGVTWAVLPPGKYTIRTLIRVPPGNPFLFRTAEVP